jgi:hypothetical protein
LPEEVETPLPLQRAVSVTTPAVYGSTPRLDGSVSPVVSSILTERTPKKPRDG